MITHPSEVAHSLEVDKVAFAGVQRAVPVAIISVIVAHGEGACLLQAAGWQLGCVVVWRSSGLCLTMGHRQWETVLEPQLPLHFLPSLLLNHHLVCTGQQGRCAILISHFGIKPDLIYTFEMISSPDRCSSPLGRAQQYSNCALCLTQWGRHVSIIKCGSWG